MTDDTKKPVLIYLLDEERDWLQEESDSESRSLSAMGRLLILEGLERRTED